MIQYFDREAKAEEVSEVLLRDGVVIVRERVAEDLLRQLEEDVRPDLEKMKPGGGGPFYGGSAKLMSAIFARSFVLGDMMTDPLLTGVADIVLGPHCDKYQIGVSALLEVWKGGQNMTLHRDSDTYYPHCYYQSTDSHPIQVQIMFALSDFTADNGATRFVVGSHRWPHDQRWKESDIDLAIMPRGSVAMWIGGMLHGFGINRTDTPRTGVTAGFTLGWLRQEENQYLSIPPERIAQFPDKVRDLLGWAPHSPVLGWVGANDPDKFGEELRKKRADAFD